MKLTSYALFETPRTWQIVSADLDLAHVFLPLTSFSFSRGKDPSGFELMYSCQKPQPDCFADTLLVPKGQSTPAFEDVITNEPDLAKSLGQPVLPTFKDDAATMQKYQDVAAAMATFMEKDPDVQRLEGVIRVPCHAHGTDVKDPYLKGHSPLWIKTVVQVYQFPNVVNGDGPLLVIRAPLSPVCPMNGNGTVLGVPK